MDETTQYNCDKIFNISNHIYNCIKKGISPSGMNVDYTNIKSIWTSFIGINITLSQQEFNDLNSKCKHLKALLDRIEYVVDTIKVLDMNHKCNYINNNAGMFDIYLEDFNNVFDFINNDIQNLQKKEIIKSKLIPEKNNTSKGTKWITTLFNFYLKYEGKKQVSANEFFYHIRDIWDKIDNNESIEITHIIENILGGGTMKNLSYNLRDWLIKNGDVILKYKDIINVSIEPIEEVIEFDPEEYIVVLS